MIPDNDIFSANGHDLQEKSAKITQFNKIMKAKGQKPIAPDSFDNMSWDEIEHAIDMAKQAKSNFKSKDTRIIKTGEGFTVSVPVDALVDPQLSSTDVRLLAIIIELCGKNGYCWHSVETLSKLMPNRKPNKQGENRVDPKTIQRALPAETNPDKLQGELHGLARYIEVIAPAESKRRGYQTKDAPTNTIVLRGDINVRRGATLMSEKAGH